MVHRGQGACSVKPVIYLLNIDAQDAQDNKNGTLLRGKRTGSMIGCSFEVIHYDSGEFRNPC